VCPRANRRGQYLLFDDDSPPPTLRDVAEAVRVSGLDGLPDAKERADRARYQEVTVRSGMAKAVGMPFTWTLNPYRGCTHACEYCYARKYQRHLELDAGDQFSSVILVKRNLPEVLRRELTRPSWSRELVAVGTATDPYQPIEGHYRLTRRCLDVLVETRTPFSIVTKGPMVVRDQDVLIAATAGAGCRVYMSVPSVDEAAWTALEPGTAHPLQRLRAVRALKDAGIDTGILMMPLVPGISTSRSAIERTIASIADAGVPLLGSCVARFDPGAREHFFEFLARRYPDLVARYEQLYRSSRADPEYVRVVKTRVDEAAATRRRVPVTPGTPRSGPAAP
jgi:DNA repair photolyase